MKRKKLTKREWFEAAWFWTPSVPSHGLDNRYSGSSWEARNACHDAIPEVNVGRLCDDDRWHIYSQYCLERAGIPAGDL